MKQHHPPRSDYKHGTVTVEFGDASHLRNSIYFAQSEEKSAEFYAALGRLVSMASADAAPYQDAPGRDAKLKIWPDSLTSPSFAWGIYVGTALTLNGGLLWYSDRWNIHT